MRQVTRSNVSFSNGRASAGAASKTTSAPASRLKVSPINAAAAASIGAAPTFLVAKATECFLATVIAEGVKASAARARAAPEDSAARKKPRLTYDDVRAAALSLKDAGLLANVAFLNRVLPLRTEEDPKPEPRAPKTEGATGAALAAAGAAPAEGAAASAAAVAAE